jgi:seryl-tRNA synthetase
MAANKSTNGKRGAGGTLAREADRLKKKVKELTLKLEREVKARKLDVGLAAEAKKARDQLTREVKVLREHGKKLSSQMKSTLTDSKKRQQALTEARNRIGTLQRELRQKTTDLKRKSIELGKLVAESAHRAVGIIRHEPPPIEKPAVAKESMAAAAQPEAPVEAQTGPSDEPPQN